jgi:hypothetical protein
MASKSDKKSEIIQNTISTQDSMQFADEAVGSASENIKASSASAPGDRMAHEIVNQIDKMPYRAVPRSEPRWSDIPVFPAQFLCAQPALRFAVCACR